MFSLFRKDKPVAVEEPVVDKPSVSDVPLRCAIDTISQPSSHMGSEAAEVCGLFEDTQKTSCQAVEDVNDGVDTIVATLHQLSQAAQTIAKIALQTRLVAFNASVEAQRAGETGRGLDGVADAVKDLVARVESSSKEIVSTVDELDSHIDVLSRGIRVVDDEKSRHGGFPCALVEVQSGRSQRS